MNNEREHVATAVVLWAESMRQDPAGTLPDSDIELASLARFHSLEEWKKCKEKVLHGWTNVFVEDEAAGGVIQRLGHLGLLRQIVEEMSRRRRGRDGAREAARLGVRKSRIRKKMQEMHIQKHIIEDDRVIHVLAEYFEKTDLYITHENLRQAMVDQIGYTGEVLSFPKNNDASRG